MIYFLNMQPRKKLPKTALPRIYFIDHELRKETYPNAPALAKKYETSVSSINRDIAYMRDMMGAPIEYDRFKKGFYYTEKTFHLPAAFATADDLLALGMAKNLMDLYQNTPIHGAALNLLESISAPLHNEADAEWFMDRIIITKTASPIIDPAIWNKIVTSMRENRVITFHYIIGDKEQVEKRRVRPYQLLFDRNTWYLFTHDEDRDYMRIFAVSRILDIEYTDDVFKIPKDFDYRSLEGKSYFGVYTNATAQKFVITIYGDTRWIKERVWAEDQKIKEKSDGIELSFTSNQLDKVLEWILSQGAYAVPKAPSTLVKQWKQIITEMADLAKKIK
jgi:predicted DNA-binding transcriptional regulator YafY